jgi:hypothetical protein
MILRPVVPLLLCCAPLSAQDFDFEIDAGLSSSSLTSEVAIAMPSTVIGDYDAIDNPGGTRTLPGLFGAGTNEAIPMDLTLTARSLFDGSSSGDFGMTVDTTLLILLVHDLEFDVLGGSSADTNLIVTLLYNHFRTFQPDSLYLGGIPFDVPIGTSTISDLTLVQANASAPGVLVPGATAGEYDFAAAVLVDLSFVIDFQGQETPVGPLSMTLPIRGALVLEANAATASFGFAVTDQQTIPDPVPGFAIDDAPLDLPTILPPGQIAHLLLDATISSLDTITDISVAVVANGTPGCGFDSYCPANVNSSGSPATLSVSGSTDVTAADLTFDCVDLPSNQFGMFLMSRTQDFVPLFGGSQGNLCLGAPRIRFGKDILNSGPAGAVQFSPDFANLPQGTVFEAGSTWNFQFWFRDRNPMATSNTSNGVEVVFCP